MPDQFSEIEGHNPPLGQSEEVRKELTPVRSGLFFSTMSRYFVNSSRRECLLHLTNDTESRVVITKVILSSIASSIWDITVGEVYSDGGVPADISPFFIETNGGGEVVNPVPAGLTVMTQDRNNQSSIRLVGTATNLLYRLTNAYDTREILGGDEILLAPHTSFCIKVRSEAGVTAPVNCEVRFYLEKA